MYQDQDVVEEGMEASGPGPGATSMLGARGLAGKLLAQTHS